MQFNILSFADNAQGQLDSGISASVKTIALKAGEGAEFPQAYDGTATSGGDINTLNATGIGVKASVGDFIWNITDGSHAWIKTVNTNSVETTDLIGGTGNTWDNSDAWSIKPFAITINSRDGDGQITASEKSLVIGRSTDTLTINTRGYDSSSAQTWSADDYVDLFVVEKGFGGISDAISEIAQLVQDLSDDKADSTTVTALFNARVWKQSAEIATTANITLSGEQTIDGTLTSSTRILVKNQTTVSQNGIYVTASGAWTRATDFDATAEITSAVVEIDEGTTNENDIYQCTSDDPVVGTDDIVFAKLHPISETVTEATQTNFILGEAFSSDEVGYSSHYSISQLLNDLDFVFGTAGDNKVGQTFTPALSFSVATITLSLQKNASPTDNLLVKIYASDKTTLLGTSEVVDGSTLTTSYLDYDFDFATPVQLTASTVYFFELSRSGAFDATNNYDLGIKDADVYAGGTFWNYGSGLPWSEQATRDSNFIITSSDVFAYKTDANGSGAELIPAGYADEAGSLGDTVAFNTSGIATVSTTGTPAINETMYLSDTAGEVQNSAGSSSVKVGRMISLTEMLIIPPPL